MGRRHLLAVCCGFLLEPQTTVATVFLDTEGGTGFGRTATAADGRAALGLWCEPAAAAAAAAVPDDGLPRPVAMSLANTMAAAAGAPDGCWRLRGPGPGAVPSTTATVGPAPRFNISPTTLGGPADRWPCSAPGGMVNMFRVRKDDGNAGGPSTTEIVDGAQKNKKRVI